MSQGANANFPTLEQALDDVEARFLYNLPKSELEHTERLFFQIEQAYWFYEDFKADVYSHLPHFSTLKAFATKLFSYSALLSKAGDKFQELFSDFRNYKSKIPVFGCIMLNPPMTKVVLVCDYNGKSWTFPRGKVNENETEFTCAVREVYEETGFDVTPHCKEEDNLQAFIDGKQIKLFVACNVPESTVFTTQTRKEISEVAFHSLDALPKTYAVNPFLEKLRRWITKRKQQNAKMLKSPALKGNLAVGKSPARTAANAAQPAQQTKSRKGSAAGNGAQGSPPVTSINGHGGNSQAVQPSPSTAKRLKNVFDARNGDTFEEGSGATRWGVDDMFAANARITGKNYVYDGNPHQFGASHPRYVNYVASQDAVSSRSIFGASPTFPSLSPTPLDELRRNAYMPTTPGIASVAQGDDEGFRALSEQSLLGNQLLRSSRAQDPHDTVRLADFKLPLSAFKFDPSHFKPPRHDSFDSTHSKDYVNSGAQDHDAPAVKVVFPVHFQLNRAEVMAAFDRAMSKGR